MAVRWFFFSSDHLRYCSKNNPMGPKSIPPTPSMTSWRRTCGVSARSDWLSLDVSRELTAAWCEVRMLYAPSNAEITNLFGVYAVWATNSFKWMDRNIGDWGFGLVWASASSIYGANVCVSRTFELSSGCFGSDVRPGSQPSFALADTAVTSNGEQHLQLQQQQMISVGGEKETSHEWDARLFVKDSRCRADALRVTVLVKMTPR